MPDLKCFNRRDVVAFGALGLSGCAGVVSAPPVLVNLAEATAPLTPLGEARLDTGEDAALRMTAPVRVNGQGPFPFVVDTGANRTVISSELAEALRLPSSGVANVHGVSGVEPAPTVRIDLLEVDAVSARGLRAPTLPRSRLGVDGLIGVDILKDRRVVLDFVRQALTIRPERGQERSAFDMRRDATGNMDDRGRGVVVPAQYRFGQLMIIGADVAARPVIAFLDTGSQSTVGNGPLRRLVVGNANAPRAVQLRVPILSATGQVSEGELATMPLLKIGGLSLSNLTAVFADLHVFDIWDLSRRPSLMLGMDVIRQFSAIELRYAHREVVFYLRNARRRRSE